MPRPTAMRDTMAQGSSLPEGARAHIAICRKRVCIIMPKSQDVLPVVLSILIIILVAILEKQSKMLAAVTATMPLAAPLTLWIVHVSSGGDQSTLEQFSRGLLLWILPTVVFLATAWLTTRSGKRLNPTLHIRYAVWSLGVLVFMLIRRRLGLSWRCGFPEWNMAACGRGRGN